MFDVRHVSVATQTECYLHLFKWKYFQGHGAEDGELWCSLCFFFCVSPPFVLQKRIKKQTFTAQLLISPVKHQSHTHTLLNYINLIATTLMESCLMEKAIVSIISLPGWEEPSDCGAAVWRQPVSWGSRPQPSVSSQQQAEGGTYPEGQSLSGSTEPQQLGDSVPGVAGGRGSHLTLPF